MQAARLCFKYLKPGGYLRVAVPDGYHTDPNYIAHVQPGGIGPGADDHKVLYTYKTFSETFASAGFHIELLEYFDEHGSFQANPWKTEDGTIYRSMKLDPRNQDRKPNYTSLILDARKP